MEQDQFKIGAKVEHSAFGMGVITNVGLTTVTIFFATRGDKEISRTFEGLKLVEPSKIEEGEGGGGNRGITIQDLEKVFSTVLRRYVDYPEIIEMGDKWKKGTMILQPGVTGLKGKEIPIEAFFHKIVLVRDRLRVMEQRINSNSKLEDEEKVNLQQYITRIYGSLTTFNLLFKHKEQYFVGDKGIDD